MEIDIAGINQGDEAAWRELYQSYYAALCSYAHNFLPVQSDDEDVVQETLLNIWKLRTQFADERHLTYYLYQAVYRNSMSKIRSHVITLDISNASRDIRAKELEWSDDEFVASVREEMYRRLWNGIKDLPPRRREILEKSIEGKSIKEIATEMGISISSVKNAKAAAIKDFRQMTKSTPLLLLL